jgi:hypothetical protein
MYDKIQLVTCMRDLRGDLHFQVDWYMFQPPAETFARCLSSGEDDLISCDGLPEYYQQCNANKTHC